jgi:hypothetical protein
MLVGAELLRPVPDHRLTPQALIETLPKRAILLTGTSVNKSHC